MKTCRKCKKKKEETLFYRRHDSADGLQYCCKACSYEGCRDRDKRNPEQTKNIKRKYRLAHPPTPEQRRASKEYQRRWYKKNKKRITASARAGHGNATRLKRQYGITLKDFSAFLKAQKNRCAVCLFTKIF